MALSASTDLQKLSLQEWEALPDDVRGELVDGRLVEEEVPDYIHELLVSLLTHTLGGWAFPRGGLVGGSDAKFAVAANRGRKPDITVYLPDSQWPPRRGLVRVPPDIAVEIVSPSLRDTHRDRVEKKAEYAAFGIRSYWIVDPELRSVEIYELGSDGSYRLAVNATSGIVDVPGFEGLAVDLDALWAHTDRLS